MGEDMLRAAEEAIVRRNINDRDKDNTYVSMLFSNTKDVLDYVIYVKGMTFNVICDAKSDKQITADKLYDLWQKRLLIDSLKYENFNEQIKTINRLLRKITQNKDLSN